jgi:phospholipase/carboxylesterase
MRLVEFGELSAVLAGGSDRDGGGDGPVVVLLHGYGAPGEDLVPLFRVLEVPREVRFVFPAAPLVLDPLAPAALAGRAWWPLDFEALLERQASGDLTQLQLMDPPGIDRARAQVEGLLDALPSALSVKPESILLGGFSQGAMLSVEVALASQRPLAGLAILSGTLIRKSVWTTRAPARHDLPVLQSHGRTDPILPYANAEALRELLTQAGLSVEWLPFGGGHGIPDSAVDRLGVFIRRIGARPE